MSDPTNAERQARHRAKQRKQQEALAAELRALRDRETPAKAGGDTAALEAEIAALKRYIAEVREQRDTALAGEASMRKMLDDGHRVIAQAKGILAVKAIFPPEFRKTLLHATHEDRVADPKWKVRYRTVFQFLDEHERMLFQKPPPPRPDALPKTWEEWEERKWRVKEERKAKRTAKKAAKKNPPKALR
jgi:hypothetical protein